FCALCAFCAFLWLTAWTSGPHGQLRSGIEIDIVTTLNVYRSRTSASANHSANRRAFTTTGNCPNDGTDRSTDRRALDCLIGLVAFAYRTFIVHPNDVAIRRTNRFENTCEAIAPAVSHTNRVEVESHLGTPGDSATTVDAADRAFKRRTVKLAR